MFVELKGSDVDHAETQLASSLKMVCGKLPAKYQPKGGCSTLAVVLLAMSTPLPIKKRTKDFYQLTKTTIRYKFGCRGASTDLHKISP